jgi:hypothetical protein
MRQLGAGARALGRYFGWWSLGLLLVVVFGLVSWWNWDRSRQVPFPPQAQGASTELLGALARKTTFAVPASAADVRAFYRQTLPQRGWSYCGTQATPRCSNLVTGTAGAGDQVDVYRRAEDQVDVYRRAEDQEYSGTTIEVWAAEQAGGGTTVSVFEANPNR